MLSVTVPRRLLRFAAGLLVLASGLAAPAIAAEVLHVYGPGGPAPAMKEAAEAFGKARGVTVEVTAGPTGQWIDKAKADADLIYSGSEHMMTDFIAAMEGRLVEETVHPLYLRPSAILVRPGNPQGIGGFEDLLKPGRRVLVVQGAGQTGLWEDIAGRKGDIRTVRALRRNIVAVAPTTAAARQIWIDRPEIDAWIVWNIWQVSNPQLADAIAVEPDYVIYRDTAAALTRTGMQRPLAADFLAFLGSAEGADIFARWGWKTEPRQDKAAAE